jgi:hypothetical protein
VGMNQDLWACQQLTHFSHLTRQPGNLGRLHAARPQEVPLDRFTTAWQVSVFEATSHLSKPADAHVQPTGAQGGKRALCAMDASVADDQ